MSKLNDVTGGRPVCRTGTPRAAGRAAVWTLLVALLALPSRPARAASDFPGIPVWSIVGAWQDSSLVRPNRCVGSFRAPLADSIAPRSRTVTVRFLRDRSTEDRPDFGGYRVYRMSNAPDSSKAVLIRRFSQNAGSELTWNSSRVTRTSSISVLPNDVTTPFAARSEITAGITPVAIAVADLNRDNFQDLAIANQGSNSITVLLGDGAGGVLGRAQIALGISPSAIVAAPRDTVVDLLVSSSSGRDLVAITGNPAGGFNAAVATPVATGPSSLAVADVNGDGVADCIVAGESTDSVTVVLRSSNGSFLGIASFLVVGSQPVAVAAGDVNGDSRADIAVLSRATNTVSVFTGLGGGLFGFRTDYSTGTGPSAVAIRDVTGDGNADVLVTNSVSNTVTVLVNNGLGGFSAGAVVPTGTGPRGFAVADLDGDGKLDLAVANQGANTVSVLKGDGAGGFSAGGAPAAGVGPINVSAGDFTGDGKPDLLVSDFSYRLPYTCNGATVNDSVITFVDPDSIGQYVKVCRHIDVNGRCNPVGDSIFVLRAPPGPHDGFLTWYSITYERRNTTDPDYEDLFVPDTLDNFARCTSPLDRGTCPNLNHKLRNLTSPLEPTPGPTANLEQVLAVPNPYRGSEVWDQPGGNEVHFINLPSVSKIRIYTVAGDLVRELHHDDRIRDFERWDLKNGSGNAVASGIYVYRVESGSFHFQSRLVVIR